MRRIALVLLAGALAPAAARAQPCDLEKNCGGVTFQHPVRQPNPLTALVKSDATELRRDGVLVWVEWLQRGEGGGSYLHARGRQAIGVQGSNYLIEAGTGFVFKAPDQPARAYVASRTFAIPKGRDDLSKIALAIEGSARFLSEPVLPWTGNIQLEPGTWTEIKKDWTDGEIVEIIWATGRGREDRRRYLRVISGSVVPKANGILGFGADYKVLAGTVFDIKDAHISVERHTARVDFWIAKNGNSSIADMRLFFEK